MPSILPYILKDTLNDIFSKIALPWNFKYAQHFLKAKQVQKNGALIKKFNWDTILEQYWLKFVVTNIFIVFVMTFWLSQFICTHVSVERSCRADSINIGSFWDLSVSLLPVVTLGRYLLQKEGQMSYEIVLFSSDTLL